MQHCKVDHAGLPIIMCRRSSAPLATEHLESGVLSLPPMLIRLWRHWRMCGRNDRAPRATAMEIDQLRHLGCLTRFVAHVVPDGQLVNEPGGFHVLTANQLPSLEASSSMNAANSEPGLLPFHPAEANEMRQDWPRILNGQPVLRVVALISDSVERPVARLCLPIRMHAGATVDSMIVAAEPADIHCADIWGGADNAGAIGHQDSGPAGVNPDNAGPDNAGPDNAGMEPSSLPLETRLAFKARIQEATSELKRQAACRPDAERRGMLLEAARLQRLARKY